MRENETHRRPLWIAVEKQFLILHDKVVSINIVGSLLFFIGDFAVRHFAFLINGEITGMGIVSGDSVKILNVIFIAKFALHIAHNIVILFFKHLGINAVVRISCLIVLLVLCYLVDKKQAQYFDTLMEKLALPLDMRENCLADLNATELLFADFSDDIPCKNFDAVQELYRVIPAVDKLDNKSVFILI